MCPVRENVDTSLFSCQSLLAITNEKNRTGESMADLAIVWPKIMARKVQRKKRGILLYGDKR